MSVVALSVGVVGVALAAGQDHPHMGPEDHGENKVFRFPSDLRAGDCHMDGATLVIHSNGHAVFDSQVWTHTHGTDIWHSTIHLVGPGGEKGGGHADSPGMPHDADGPEHKRGFHYEFDFPPGQFGSITEAWEHGDC